MYLLISSILKSYFRTFLLFAILGFGISMSLIQTKDCGTKKITLLSYKFISNSVSVLRDYAGIYPHGAAVSGLEKLRKKEAQ